MKTIKDLKRSQHICDAKNELTVCFPIDRQLADFFGSEPDCNNFFSLIMVETGKLNCSINYHEVLLQHGDLIIISPQILMGFNNISEDFKAYYLAVEQVTFEGMMARDTAYKHLMLYYSSASKPIIHCADIGAEIIVGLMNELTHLMQCAVTNIYVDKMMLLIEQALMLQVVNLLPISNEPPKQLSHKEEILLSFIDLLLKNYRQQHSALFYADRLNITPNYLGRIIKSITGRTMKNFILDMLYKDAIYMLRHTDMPIQDIGCELGFTDLVTFSKFFKNISGIAPQYYRQQN